MLLKLFDHFLMCLCLWELSLSLHILDISFHLICGLQILFPIWNLSFLSLNSVGFHEQKILVLIVERIFQTSFFDSSSSTIRMLLDGYCRTESSYDTTSDLSPFGHLIWGVSPVGWRSISRRCYYSMSASNDPKVTMNYVPLKYPTNSQLNVSPAQLLLSWIPNCS